MHEKEFERSVQQSLEDLSFAPSAPVWQQVEARIRAPRKKRRLIFWLLPLFIAGGAAVWLWQDGAGSPHTSTTDNQIVTTHKPVKKETSNQKETNSVAIENNVAENKPAAFIEKENSFLNANRIFPKNKRFASAGDKVFARSGFTGTIKAATDLKQDSFFIDALHETKQPILAARQVDSINRLAAMHNQLLENWQPDSALVKDIVLTNKKTQRRWHWSVQVQYGRSWAGSEGRIAASNLNFTADPAAAPPSNNIQATVRDGHFLSAGFLLHRSINSRISLSGGLQYSQYTQRISVGKKRMLGAGTSASFSRQMVYEAGSGGGYYYNKFEMLSLPLAVGVQPFHSLPLEAQLGIAPGYLFRNRALQYLPGTPYFTEVNPDVQRWQLPLQAAVHVQLYAGPKFGLRAGPFVNVHLTGINNRTATSRRFNAAGAALQFQLK